MARCIVLSSCLLAQILGTKVILEGGDLGTDNSSKTFGERIAV